MAYKSQVVQSSLRGLDQQNGLPQPTFIQWSILLWEVVEVVVADMIQELEEEGVVVWL